MALLPLHHQQWWNLKEAESRLFFFLFFCASSSVFEDKQRLHIICRSSCDVLAFRFAPWLSEGLLTDCTSSSAVHTADRSNSAYPRTLKLCSVARRHSHRLVMENENRSSSPAEISRWGVTAWHVGGNLLYNEHAAALWQFIMQLSSKSECEVDQRSAKRKGDKVFQQEAH